MCWQYTLEERGKVDGGGGEGGRGEGEGGHCVALISNMYLCP